MGLERRELARDFAGDLRVAQSSPPRSASRGPGRPARADRAVPCAPRRETACAGAVSSRATASAIASIPRRDARRPQVRQPDQRARDVPATTPCGGPLPSSVKSADTPVARRHSSGRREHRGAEVDPDGGAAALFDSSARSIDRCRSATLSGTPSSPARHDPNDGQPLESGDRRSCNRGRFRSAAVSAASRD